MNAPSLSSISLSRRRASFLLLLLVAAAFLPSTTIGAALSTCQAGPGDTICTSQENCDGTNTCCYLTGSCTNSQEANCNLGSATDSRFPPANGPNIVNQGQNPTDGCICVGADFEYPNPSQNCDVQYPGAPSQGCWGTLRCDGVGTCKDTGYCESGNSGAYLGGICIQNGAGGTFKYCGYSIFNPSPTIAPTFLTMRPSSRPTTHPSKQPSKAPTKKPSAAPTVPVTGQPTVAPTPFLTAGPTVFLAPTTAKTSRPTKLPSPSPSQNPTLPPTPLVTQAPSPSPTPSPTPLPTPFPSPFPTPLPSNFVPFSRDPVCIDSVDISTGAVAGATEDTTGQSPAETGGGGGGGSGKRHRNVTSHVRTGKPLKPGQKVKLTQKIRSNVTLANTLYSIVLPTPVILVETRTIPKAFYYVSNKFQAKLARRRKPTGSLYFDRAQNTLYWSMGEVQANKKYTISIVVRMSEKHSTDDSYPVLPPLPRPYDVPTPAPPQGSYADFRTYFAVLEEEPSTDPPYKDYSTITCRKVTSIQVPVQTF